MTSKDQNLQNDSQKGFELTELFTLEAKSNGAQRTSGVPSCEISLKPRLNRQIISEIEKKLNLGFEEEPVEGNVCFAYNNAELRDDFKQVFNAVDILHYTFAILNTPVWQEKYRDLFNKRPLRVPFPKDTETFWELVDLGKKMRNKQL